MGVWDYGPMDSDNAASWLANEVQAPLLAAIQRTLQGYLDQAEKDDVKTDEAEAAAAFLVDLTGKHGKMKYIDLDCGWLAKEDDLWSLASTVVKKIMQDEIWINDFNEPQQKRAVLEQLLTDLQACQEATAREFP